MSFDGYYFNSAKIRIIFDFMWIGGKKYYLCRVIIK